MNKLKKNLRVKWTPGKIDKVIIDLPQGLGDQIMCFPLMASLKRYNPDMHITVVTFNKISVSLLGYNKNIDSVKTFDMDFTVKGLARFFMFSYYKLYSLLKKEKYDLLIFTHPNIVRDLLFRMLPVERKIYNIENAHKFTEISNVLEFLDIPVVKDYSVDFNFISDILMKNNLKKNEYILLDIYAQYLDEDPRQWPYFPELISALKQKIGKPVVLAGINKNHVPVDGVVDLVNGTNFKELLFLIQNAAVVVSMDTFFFHISYCLKTPVVALFGPVNPADRIPKSDDLAYKTIYKKLSCSPCIKNKVKIKCDYNYQCMKDIPVDEVIDSIGEYL
jgi:ADP-heptose:LPS heptosyltransferase